MQFIAIMDDGCFLETGNDVFEFLKKLADQYCGIDAEVKVFSILIESGKMELPELVQYMNGRLLISAFAINEIYSVGAKIF